MDLKYPLVSDGVIALRAWRDEDVTMKLSAFGDPWFAQFSDWAPRTEEAIVQRIEAVELARQEGRAVHCAIVDAADEGSALGEVSVSGIDVEQGRGSVGYWLSPAARGRGAASRAVRLMTAWAFEEVGLARLELTCGPDNVASQRVAERSGFQLEGRLRSHLSFKGGRRDSLIFGLLPSDL